MCNYILKKPERRIRIVVDDYLIIFYLQWNYQRAGLNLEIVWFVSKFISSWCKSHLEIIILGEHKPQYDKTIQLKFL